MPDLELGILVFLQIGVILAACRLFGWLGTRYLGQSQVVMEMVAGVFLGPSVLGAVSPDLSRILLPLTLGGGKHPAMQVLYVMSQVGLGLYMFVVGMEFDLKLLKERSKGAAAVSVAGILLPFVLGALLSLAVAGDSRFFAPGVSPGACAVYLGSAMCITAFPMLARIISEKGLTRSNLGVLALAAGSFNDVVAWILLAFVLASAKGNPLFAISAVGGGTVFAVLVLTLGRKFFTWLESRMGETLDDATFVAVVGSLMLCCWATDRLGVYAVFGAFICGSAIPKGKMAHALREKIHPLTVGLLLPLFFVYSGLNTRIGLLADPRVLMVAVLVLLAATLGKGIGCGVAARLSGEGWRESVAIGTLMNARGLMELIILNIGLQQGIVKPAMFAVLVVMAVVTTLAASPMFEWAMRRLPGKAAQAEPA